MPAPQDPHTPDHAADTAHEVIHVDSFVGDNAVYAVDPQAWTCTCAEWRELRAGFKERDVRRFCPHLLHVFRMQPELLPGNFKERDRRIVERLEPLHLGYPICRRIVSLPLPMLAHQSGPDSADIFFLKDRTSPWVSVLNAEGLFHYHPAEDRWANRYAPSDMIHRQTLELRIHKALHQETGGVPPHAQSPEQPGSPYSGSPLASQGEPQPAYAPPHHPGDTAAGAPWDMPDEAIPPVEPLHARGEEAAAPRPHRPVHFDMADAPPRPAHSSGHAATPASQSSRFTSPTPPPGRGKETKEPSHRSPGCLILALAAACALGAVFFLHQADVPLVSLGSLTRAASKLFQRETPPPPLPGHSEPAKSTAPAADAPPSPGLQTASDGLWPQTEQAKDILKLIQANPSQGRYTITKKLPDSVVLFGVDLDVQSIYRIERFTNGTESRDSWLGNTKFRLESAAQGGTLADVPK
ncbi:hypothetical protein [Megalodesulfovibrio paquesii]